MEKPKNERIIDRNLSEQFRTDYQTYGIYIMFRRVMPDYKDGLKPVQRRILWAMFNDTHAITKKVKSAGVVGDTMKHYHPHGDSAIYGTIKPLANWFECYTPLITPHGNFGSFYGDPAAAYRYTECKISEFSMDCFFRDIRLSTKSVDWSPNYDYTEQEPDFLPCSVPLLLINGSFGIGLGKKTEIPAHNINEVIDATLALIQNPAMDITLIPDTCMKCEIIETDFSKISKNGFGYYRVRGAIDIEEYKGRPALVIKSVPDMTFFNSIIEEIGKLVSSKKLIQIERCVDESQGDTLRYIIVLKHGSDPEYVKNVIYKNTQLEHTERINFEVLDGLNPIRMSYKSYLLSFIDHRKLTKFRIYSNRLQEVQTQIHEKETYIYILESGKVDEVSQYIKKQKDVDDNRLMEWLIKTLNITDLQAKFVMGVDFKKLSIGYLNLYKKEVEKLEGERKVLMNLVMNDQAITEDIVKELQYMKSKYGHKRNSRLIRERLSNEIPHGKMTVIVTERNFIKKIPEGININTLRGNGIRTIIQDDNAENILIFDTMGKVFKLPINNIPFTDPKANGTDIRFLIKGLTADISTIIPESIIKQRGDKNRVGGKDYLVCLTHNGLIKRMDISDFLSVPPSGILFVKLDENDYVASIKIVSDNQGVIVYSDKRAMSLMTEDIPLTKRNSKGNKTFKDSFANGMEFTALYKEFLIVITNTGRINKIPTNSIPNLQISKKLFSVIKLSKTDSIFSILMINSGCSIHVKTLQGEFDIPVDSIPMGSSIGTGDKMINLKGDRIIRAYELLK